MKKTILITLLATLISCNKGLSVKHRSYVYEGRRSIIATVYYNGEKVPDNFMNYNIWKYEQLPLTTPKKEIYKIFDKHYKEILNYEIDISNWYFDNFEKEIDTSDYSKWNP